MGVTETKGLWEMVTNAPKMSILWLLAVTTVALRVEEWGWRCFRVDGGEKRAASEPRVAGSCHWARPMCRESPGAVLPVGKVKDSLCPSGPGGGKNRATV